MADPERALRRLTPTFMRKLSPDVRHELYGREQLTWMEYERIGRWTEPSTHLMRVGVVARHVTLVDCLC